MSGHRNAAFDEWVLPLLDEAFDFARHLTGSAQAAEELTQAAFTQAFEQFHRFRPGTSARAWLYTILKHLEANEARSRHRHPTVALEAVPEPRGGEPTAGDATVELDQAISRLPANLREPVVLDLQGLSCKEIGQVLSCPPGTVMSRLYRARRRIREDLEARGVTRGGLG